MKTPLLIISFLILSLSSHCQGSPLALIEASFERVIHTTAFPCHWKLQRTPKVAGLHYLNGSPLFVRDDSTRLEVEFFNTKKLPFYNPNQSSPEISIAFYTWEANQLKGHKKILLTKPVAEQLDPFVILKIKDRQSEYHRLIVTANNITYSIKLQASGQPVEKQLEDLKLLGSLNINN